MSSFILRQKRDQEGQKRDQEGEIMTMPMKHQTLFITILCAFVLGACSDSKLNAEPGLFFSSAEYDEANRPLPKTIFDNVKYEKQYEEHYEAEPEAELAYPQEESEKLAEEGNNLRENASTIALASPKLMRQKRPKYAAAPKDKKKQKPTQYRDSLRRGERSPNALFGNLRVMSDENLERELAKTSDSTLANDINHFDDAQDGDQAFSLKSQLQSQLQGIMPPPPPSAPAASSLVVRSTSRALDMDLSLGGQVQTKGVSVDLKPKREKKESRYDQSRNEKTQSEFKAQFAQQSDFVNRYLARGKPNQFWSKQGYFKNTYLGGDLAYQEELRASSREFKALMKLQEGYAWTPDLDAPHDAGMTLSANLSHRYVEHPQRVMLQVALKGSERYGWRRPALNLMVVVDPAMLDGIEGQEARQSFFVEQLKPILSRLNVADQIGLNFAQSTFEPRRPDLLKESLIEVLKGIQTRDLSRNEWIQNLERAGQALNRASADPHRAPGAQAVLLLCSRGCVSHSESIKQVVHQLNLDGTLTSVIDHSKQSLAKTESFSDSRLWQIAAAGHGGFWVTSKKQSLSEAINHEFDRFSRVVARLLRLSIKLSDGVELIEVIGSESLSEQQKNRVKAREKAMDQRLSTRLGIQSDRGEDDEGVQVVIPAFYGGDSHLIHLALWVSKAGEIAEITLKYKDMVRAQNASAAQQVSLAMNPQPLTLAQQEVLIGANRHLMAAETIKGLQTLNQIDHLPSVRALVQMSQKDLNRTELNLISRAQLGRPQSP